MEDYRVNDGKRYIKSVTVAGHSLGGALASLCAWDVADAFSQGGSQPASQDGASHEKKNGEVAGSAHTASSETPAASTGKGLQLYERVDEERRKIKEELGCIEEAKLPAVAAMTWAAPRVGDQVYASAFDGCTLVDPNNVPVKNCLLALWHEFLYACRRLQLKLGICWLSAVHVGINAAWIALVHFQLLGLSDYALYKAVMWATSAIALDNIIVTAVRRFPIGIEKRRVRPTMLRVVDAPDAVPQLPVSFPLTRLFAYAHGGHELRVNYQYIKYFLDVHPWTNPVELARWHNQEVYMHLVDPQRSEALANRTERVLAKDKAVPGAWWSPVPNNGMVTDDGGETWTKHE